MGEGSQRLVFLLSAQWEMTDQPFSILAPFQMYHVQFANLNIHRPLLDAPPAPFFPKLW